MPDEALLEQPSTTTEPSPIPDTPSGDESGPMLSLDDFESFKSPPTDEQQPTPESTSKPPQPQAKEGDEKEQEPEVEATAEGEQQQQKQEPPAKQLDKHERRDYSGLTPQQAKVARQMSNAAFNLFKPTMLENTRLRKEIADIKAKPADPSALPQSYYEHEQGYTLSKEYPELVKNYRQLEVERAHWRQQLINIRAGKDWQDIEYDSKTGGVRVVATPLKASPDADIAVSEYLQNANEGMREINRKVTDLQTNHKKGFDTIREKIKQFSTSNQLDFLDDEKQPGNKVMKDAMAIMEKDGLGANILSPITAKLYALAVLQQQMLKGFTSKVDAAKKNGVDARKAQPTAGRFSGGSKGEEKMLDLADFERE